MFNQVILIKMTEFTFEEAKLLKEYYSGILIQKPIEVSVDSKIIDLVIELQQNKKYKVICIGSTIESIIPHRNLISVLKDLHLILPEEILKKI